MGGFATVMTAFIGIRFLVKPVTATKETMAEQDPKKKILKSVIGGSLIGFICGFVGAGGGMMMLFVLTSILGYELKTAVGTSVFIMTFTAFTGSVSHFALDGMPDWQCLVLCVVFTFIFARIAAKIANKASARTLNRVTGCILVCLGIVTTVFKFI